MALPTQRGLLFRRYNRLSRTNCCFQLALMLADNHIIIQQEWNGCELRRVTAAFTLLLRKIHNKRFPHWRSISADLEIDFFSTVAVLVIFLKYSGILAHVLSMSSIINTDHMRDQIDKRVRCPKRHVLLRIHLFTVHVVSATSVYVFHYLHMTSTWIHAACFQILPILLSMWSQYVQMFLEEPSVQCPRCSRLQWSFKSSEHKGNLSYSCTLTTHFWSFCWKFYLKRKLHEENSANFHLSCIKTVGKGCFSYSNIFWVFRDLFPFLLCDVLKTFYSECADKTIKWKKFWHSDNGFWKKAKQWGMVKWLLVFKYCIYRL